jgi:general secretion pathway protein A
MSYYKVLGLDTEPFSTSPDPNFFYHSSSHLTALKRLEISIRLRRGLSLIIGDVGIGKTTLWRALVQEFKGEPEFIFHIMLDPGFQTAEHFLYGLSKMFGFSPDHGAPGAVGSSGTRLCAAPEAFKESVERYLFQKGVDENATIVLIIDEGQKLILQNLEVLRTLLNYETNEYKLLQLVIMAQSEILPRIAPLTNFTDRVSLKYTLNPLDQEETREMIEFRLRQAGYHKRFALFTDRAIQLIFERTAGYPRKISLLCHEALKAAAVKGLDSIDTDTLLEISAPSFEFPLGSASRPLDRGASL